MKTSSDHKPFIVSWAETLVTPVILGLVAGGATYVFVPGAWGLKLAIIMSGSVLVIGAVIVAVRIKKNKGRVVFHPHRKPR